MRKKAIIATLTAAVLTAMSIVPAFAAETATPAAGSQNGAVVTMPIGWEANAIDGYDESQKEHHPAYIKGYTDGTIKPWKNLKRAEAVQMLHNINSANPAPTEMFYESPQITRGEFAKLVLAAKDVKAKKLSDVLTGYPDGTLKLENTLTRDQAVTMINRAYGRVADSFSIKASMNLRIMPDVPTSYWAYYDLMEAITDHNAYGKNATEDGNSDEELWSDWQPGKVDLPQGWRNIDGKLYYVNDRGTFSYNTTVDGIKLNSEGTYTTMNGELDALLREEIVKIINNNMTQDQKLRAIYDYMIKNYSYRGAGTVEAGAVGWESEFAYNMLKSGKGNCYSWAATFAYLARQSGWDADAVSGTAVSPKGSSREHAWVEITIDGVPYTFDPEIEGVYAKTVGETYDLFKKAYGQAVWKYNKVEIEEPDNSDDVNTPVDESLVKILNKVYAGINVGFDVNDTAVTKSNESYYTGVTGLKYKAGVAREPNINAIAHSTVILQMEDGADMDAAVKAIKEKVDGYKWICVGVSDENILVDHAGNYILLTMDNEYANRLMDNFKKLSL